MQPPSNFRAANPAEKPRRKRWRPGRGKPHRSHKTRRAWLARVARGLFGRRSKVSASLLAPRKSVRLSGMSVLPQRCNRPAQPVLKILGAALQADGETKSAVTASPLHRRLSIISNLVRAYLLKIGDRNLPLPVPFRRNWALYVVAIALERFDSYLVTLRRKLASSPPGSVAFIGDRETDRAPALPIASRWRGGAPCSIERIRPTARAGENGGTALRH